LPVFCGVPDALLKGWTERTGCGQRRLGERRLTVGKDLFRRCPRDGGN
jgi:hypothetical protein